MSSGNCGLAGASYSGRGSLTHLDATAPGDTAADSLATLCSGPAPRGPRSAPHMLCAPSSLRRPRTSRQAVRPFPQNPSTGRPPKTKAQRSPISFPLHDSTSSGGSPGGRSGVGSADAICNMPTCKKSNAITEPLFREVIISKTPSSRPLSAERLASAGPRVTLRET